MNNEQAIKILKELPDAIAVLIHPEDIDWDYKEALNLAIKALEEKEWIPVSERLPEKKGWYEATFISVTGARTVGLAFYSDRVEDFAVDGVIAWKPLPKSYESEDE